MYGYPYDDDDLDVYEEGRVTWTGPKSYEVRDSGTKARYDDGMVRDTTEGKPRFDLILPEDVPFEEQLLTRVAMQYMRGGLKYGDRNWEKSSSRESEAHHKAAFWRHAVKFMLGVDDGEDHAAAVVWNVNAVDLTRRNIRKRQEIDEAIAQFESTPVHHTFATPDRPPLDDNYVAAPEGTAQVPVWRRWNPSTGKYED